MKMTTKPKKGTDSDTKDSNSEHELSYYLNDRIKMMQEALKEVKSKKLLAMAPDCLKDLQISEIKSLMLEELLGISNKRLGRILAGENLNDETSSSSDSEFEQKPEIDVISLDDITDGSEICISDDNIMEIQLSERERLEMESVAEQSKTSKKGKGKSAGHKGKNKRKVSVKKEKPDKAKKKHKKKPATIESEVCSSTSQPTTQDPVMNVLNLLELQARARAIRSQLANEVLIKKVSESETVVPDHPEQVQPKISQKYDSDSSNSVIFIGPENIAVVTVNSDSESELKEDINNDLTMDNVSPKQGRSDICINTNKKTNKSSFLDNDDDILVVSEETILEKESETTENTKLGEKIQVVCENTDK